MVSPSKFSYLKDKSVLALTATQFYSALGDVGSRTLVVALILIPVLEEGAPVERAKIR